MMATQKEIKVGSIVNDQDEDCDFNMGLGVVLALPDMKDNDFPEASVYWFRAKEICPCWLDYLEVLVR